MEIEIKYKWEWVKIVWEDTIESLEFELNQVINLFKNKEWVI